VSAGSNGSTINLTSSATLTAEQNGAVASAVQCTYDSALLKQVCTTTAGTTGVYQIVASYSGSTLTATAILTVN
jgi:hypothetical protein